ncbi:DUF2225 domain-containing protein [Paenibacillus crassostreae]|uniref:DUF2225 domain-containing protein n=1 Tax=Paenibacillus crassostreae TaxID=1763538 RepID=UPI000AC34AB3|nr:DUF2225 domain-containing protein [Paenibacillus crassostreae]
MSTLEPLYSIKINCLHCEQDFQSSRVRTSFKKSVRNDADFCSYYKEENPDYYVVRVCPKCGYASTENSATRLTDNQRKEITTKVSARWVERDFNGHRDWDNALETYKLALVCAQIIGDSERLIASILHHIAWLYRYKGDIEQEQRFLRFCLDSYILVYEHEGIGANNARLLYLIGELNRRVGDFNQAVLWFSRVINDKKIMDASMIRASREQWAVLREQMIAKKVDLPDEMKQ